MAEISDLIGKTLSRIDNCKDELYFYVDDGSVYKMYHSQDCCEHVDIEDICGELNDLVGAPILKAEGVSSEENPKEGHDDAWLWTFYHLATIKGYVTIRWYGESNGYYSVDVDFAKANADGEFSRW